MMSPVDMSQQDVACRAPAVTSGPWNPNRRYSHYDLGFSISHDADISSSFVESINSSAVGLDNGFYTLSNSHYPTTGYATGNGVAFPASSTSSRSDPSHRSGPVYTSRPPSVHYSNSTPGYGSYQNPAPQNWESQGRYSPSDSVDDIIASPNLSDYSLENGMKPRNSSGKSKANSKNRPQRRPSNRDEFDGPHQFLQRPPPGVIAMQERELPHLPTNLHIQEQDHVLNQVNDRLSQCAFDFVAKYQFPIPLTQDMRPVERPQDREWTEWVYLLKRLATKRRIPARVLYNGQIKQFVTILENSLEMRHAAKHQSRPLKDDRNILQLISAGIQVAKILKDAAAMDYLDQLYVSTEGQILERTQSRFR